ncbi:hypothetical protein HD842_004553 [Massilia aurea]|uniref:Uncharacterized protein n=1 Tax=Massilia aurea TaxID=373040 RepID=A0A7X0CGJ2_9BURK|nr:hypothetical protein [Massilia aurea]MBB6136375.1 hypothetical protein [Massilia aurea]
MYIETVRFERVFDVQSGTFSFEAGGKCEFAVVLDHARAPTAGSTYAVALSEPGNWQKILGWRDLSRPTVGFTYRPWFLAVDLVLDLYLLGFAILVAAWLFGGPWAALAAFVSLVLGAVARIAFSALRNRQIEQALLAVSPEQTRTVTMPDMQVRHSDSTAPAR